MDAAKQGWGAERWLKERPHLLFIDRACTQRFPLDIPQKHQMRAHQI